jgi:hypothetical protein
MSISRKSRPVVSIGLSLLLFAGLPGIALADQSNVNPDIPNAHINGVVTDSAGNPLAGVTVDAMPGDAHAFTAADGTYSLSVTGGSYTVIFFQGQRFYENGCYAAGFVAGTSNAACERAVAVSGPNGTTVASVDMPLAEGTTVVVTPAGATMAAASSQIFTATLTAPDSAVLPALGKGSGIDISDVSAITTFSMTGGHCTGDVCTASSGGDYTVSALYGGATGTTTLHVTGDPSSPPPSSTPPPTSTGGSGGSGGDQNGLLLATMMLGFAAAAAMSLGLWRRSLRLS